MTTISRRTLTLGLATTALAAPHLRPTAGLAAAPTLTGYIVATRFDPNDGESVTPGLTVVDLTANTTATVDAPAIDPIFPIRRTSYGIAVAGETMLVLDAATATATEVTPAAGTTFDEPLAGQNLFPPPFYAPSERYAFLADGALVKYLVDLEKATAFDLNAAFAGDDPFYQAATITPDQSRLLLGTSELVVIVSLDTIKVERTLSATLGLRSPSLSPDGSHVAFVEPTGKDRRLALRVATVDGDDTIETPFEDPSGTLFCQWISDDELLLTTLTRYGATALTRLNVVTSETSAFGVIPGTVLGPRVVANGTRAIASSDLDPATVWWLVDLERDEVIRLPDLDGMAFAANPSPTARAILFGPDDYSGMGQPGQRYAILNTATGAITTTVDRTAGQYYTPAQIASDGRTAAIGSTGPDSDELWLLDLVDGHLTVVPDQLGATFAPDGRAVLTRELGQAKPLQILDLNGDRLRELPAYDVAWWLG